MKKNGSAAFKIDVMLVAQGPPFLSEETDAQEGLGGDDLSQGSRVQLESTLPSLLSPTPPGSVLLGGGQELLGEHVQHRPESRPWL